MTNEELDKELDSEFGPVKAAAQDQVAASVPVDPDPAKQVAVKPNIPGKSTQNIIPWIEITAHSADDAEKLTSKLKAASVKYQDVKFKTSGRKIYATISPIVIEVPYVSGIIKVASEHGVSSIEKKFQVLDAPQK